MNLGCKTLVNYLREILGVKVMGLLTDNAEHILLPVLHGRIVDEKPQQVRLWVWGELVAFGDIGDTRCRWCQKVIVGLIESLMLDNAPWWIMRPGDAKVRVDMAIEGKANVHQVFNSL